MEFEKVKIESGGREAEAYNIPIKHCVDKASEVHLDDGTILLIKTPVVNVVRVIDEYAADGNPQYHVQSATLISVKFCPEDLKRKGE